MVTKNYIEEIIKNSEEYARHNKFEIIGMHNNMTGGCSGGPWLTSYNNQIYVNGINSFNYQGEEGKMYSPYFGEGFLNLINVVKDI